MILSEKIIMYYLYHTGLASNVCSVFKLSKKSILKGAMRFDNPLSMVITRSMAGHSHYQNTRHIKEARDNMKKSLGNKLATRMKAAIVEGGSVDPKLNAKLNSYIQFAKKNNVPSATIQNILGKAKEEKENGSFLILEFMGPGNSAVIVESFTSKQLFARNQFQSVLKKFGTRTGSMGCASHNFDYKGIIESHIKEIDPDMDSITEMAIDVGAEDVDIITNRDENKVLQFICDPKDLHSVQQNLENLHQDIVVANHQYIPHTFCKLTESQKDILSDLLRTVEDLEFVLNTYNNVE